MGELARFWLIVETILIPDGFLKWFYLSFFIHPIFLFFCQIFLWLKLLQKCLLSFLLYLLKFISYFCSCVFRFFKCCVIYIFSFSRLTNNTDEAIEPVLESCEITVKRSSKSVHKISQASVLNCYSNVTLMPCLLIQPKKSDGVGVDEERKDANFNEQLSFSIFGSSISQAKDVDDMSATSFTTNDQNMNEDSSSICSAKSDAEDEDMEDSSSICTLECSQVRDEDIITEDSPFVCFSYSPIQAVDMEVYVPFISSSMSLAVNRQQEEEVDEFYSKYIERMRWFDMVNCDRTCGIGAILSNQAGQCTPSPFHEVEAVEIKSASLNKAEKKRVLRSLESDLDLVYVAQICLSWDALHHQYRKVEAVPHSTVFLHKVASDIQKFQVLLERFMEDEMCSEGKRASNFVNCRFSHNSLLQVPKVSAFLEQENEEMKGEGINVRVVLKAIEKCIQAFWIFVKTDKHKKRWWKLTTSLWNCPPVEDPRDLDLLSHLTRTLQKKELSLKDSQGKQKCWFRKVVNHVEDSERKEMLLTMIDMKLVSRVLQLSVISSAQLKWCQQKLDNIEFRQGKIIRTAKISGPLFPT